MLRFLISFPLLLLAGLLAAQSPVDVGEEGMETTAPEQAVGADAFTRGFAETNVGFLHVYIDPSADPLETYLLRGEEMSETALMLLPPRMRESMTGDGMTMYAGPSIMGIEENLYITRLEGPERDQIDMFAVRDGRVVHLKTLAYLECKDDGCLQMDSYITDVDLDTNFDLIQIARRTTEEGSMDERRTVYYMPSDSKRWQLTEELDVPWEGIQFYDKGDHPK